MSNKQKNKWAGTNKKYDYQNDPVFECPALQLPSSIVIPQWVFYDIEV